MNLHSKLCLVRTVLIEATTGTYKEIKINIHIILYNQFQEFF